MVKASNLKTSIKTYYDLTKPGIIYGNLLAAIAGFLLASRGHVNLEIFLGLVFGTSFIIGSACVYNNYLDREIDQKMARTKKRAVASGKVSGRKAIIYATILGIIGFTVLALLTNLLTVIVGATGIFFYVVVYGLAKRASVHGTLVGTISGAMPPIAGYTAVTGRLDLEALLLFLILVFWQMPHFYGIAIFRADDYKAAGIPVLPVKDSVFITKVQILLYTIGFVITAVLLTVFHYTGYAYLIVLGILGLYWIWLGLKGFRVVDEKVWARKMFGFSLISLLVLCLMLSVNSFVF